MYKITYDYSCRQLIIFDYLSKTAFDDNYGWSLGTISGNPLFTCISTDDCAIGTVDLEMTAAAAVLCRVVGTIKAVSTLRAIPKTQVRSIDIRPGFRGIDSFCNTRDRVSGRFSGRPRSSRTWLRRVIPEIFFRKKVSRGSSHVFSM